MSRAHEIAADLVDVKNRLATRSGRRVLPLLDNLGIASPCDQSWLEMRIGDDPHTRHCGKCVKSVYDISSMSAEEAEEFLQSRVGNTPCVRLYRRGDGTLVTQQRCSTASRRTRHALLAVAAAGGAALCMVLPAPRTAPASMVQSGIDKTPQTIPTEYPKLDDHVRPLMGAPPPLHPPDPKKHPKKPNHNPFAPENQ